MPGFEVLGKEEQEAVNRVFTENGGILFAHGFDALRNNHFLVRDFEQAFAKKFNTSHAQAVTSGSAALLVGLRALGIGPGDEVITQSFTFVATVEAILMLGATPILTEIDETYNMDPKDLEKKITSKTKAIIPVHMAGVSARMDEILNIAKENKIPVLEDSAQGVGATFDGKPLGTVGDIGCFSLDFGKTITTGEGGMVVTNSPEYFQNSREFHDHGHEYNPNYGRAQDPRKTWGFNFRMSELQAAVGLVQLEKMETIISKSRKNKAFIKNALSEIKEITFRTIPEKSEDSGDSLYFYFENKARCQEVLKKFSESGVPTKNVPDALNWHFAAYWEHMFHDHPEYKTTYEAAWPKSRDLIERSIALPVMINWDEKSLNEFVTKILKCF